jgi:hypothetical protein
MQHGWSIRLAGLAPAGLIAACLATPAADDPSLAAAGGAGQGVPAPASAAYASIDWSQGDCLSRLRILQQAASEGRLGPDARPPFAVQLVRAPGDWLDAVPELPLEADLPLALDDAGSPGGARCVIRIGPARNQRAAHRAVDVQDVRSAYQSGLRNERNPDYDAAQLALREAKDDAKGRHQVVEVGDPLLDLIGITVGGLIGTVDRYGDKQEVEAAAADLAATPRSRDRPIWRPYSFERIVVRAQKQAVVPVVLLDAAGRTLRSAELRQHERREFFVLQGLDPRDRDYEQHRSSSMTRADLARWARTPPALSLSSVAIALTEGPATETGRAGIAPAAGPTRLAPAAPDQPDLWPDDAALTADLAGPRLEDIFADADPPAGPAGAAGLDLAGLEPSRASGRSVAPVAAQGQVAPQSASVVAIRAGSAAGNGFYVRENLLLTTYRLVATVSVVDVTTADGATVPALVAAVDPARGLALLHVPRPGPAAALYQGTAPAPARPLGAGDPGLPVLWDGQIVGMTTGAADVPGQGIVPSAAIRAFLDSQAALLAAMP